MQQQQRLELNTKALLFLSAAVAVDLKCSGFLSHICLPGTKSGVLCYVPNMHIYIAQGFVVRVVVVLIGRRWSIGTGLLLLFLILLFLQVNRY